MKANEIITVLNNFKDSSYQRILINGNWGIGKTKYVSDFKEQYSNSCYISLFGKKSIDSIIQEIYFRIIENAPNGEMKKSIGLFREKLNKLNFSFYGVSLSIPVIENIHKSLDKELGRKDTYIIIFDDLERKDGLSIKEILGLIDSFSKIDNIKTVLIAATDQLKDDDKDIFIKYSEKSIDRTYKIEDYADEAPARILGEETWNVIGKLAKNFKFKNLRTFEKTSLFIKEVIEVLKEDILSDKFTKDDLYRMCFATIIFNIEHEGKMVLLGKNGDRAEVMNAMYTQGENEVIQYLCNYFLRTPLDNLHKLVFIQIKSWYETGTYSREHILMLIDNINKNEKQQPLLYSTEQEILEFIDHYREYIRNLSGDEPLEEIILKLSSVIEWCEVFSIDFGISSNEFIAMINSNISKRIDIEKNIHEDYLLWDIPYASDEGRRMIKSINEALIVEYNNQLINRIKNCFIERSYGNYTYLRRLTDSIITIKDNAIRDNLLKSLSDNKFFFPTPYGKITQDHWEWCNLIIKLIANINLHWEIGNYYDDFKAYIYSLEVTKEDKMLQFRLKQLFGESRI